MSQRKLALPIFGLGLGLLAGCAPDPWAAPPSWTFTGANAANLAGMLADPMDLVRGRTEGGASGQLAAAAVTRLRRDQVRQLPNIDTTAGQVGGTSPGGGGNSGGSAAAATAESP